MISASDESWSLAQIQEYFKNYSSSYDKGMSIDTYPAPFIIASWVKQELRQRDSVRLMDLGCGTGARYFTFLSIISSRLFFDDEKFQVSGIDATLEMLEMAKKLPFKTLTCQNLEDSLDAESDFYDAVVSIGVFDFIVNVDKVLGEISRILTTGGVAGITIPENGGKWGCKEFTDLLNQCNLQVIKTQVFFGYTSSIDGQDVNFIGFLLRKI